MKQPKKLSFNTSHVVVYRPPRYGPEIRRNRFNTSHVVVYPVFINV